MGLLTKIVGFLLVLAGPYGLFISIPSVLFNVIMDEINPLIMFGIIESQTPSTILDLLLSLAILFIGILFLKRKDPIPKLPK